MIDGNTKLLVTCPSRIRPHRLKEMLKSFDDTASAGTEIIVYVSSEDPRLNEYLDVLAGRSYVINERRHLVQVLNYVSCDLYPNIKYYGEVNDDHIYRTRGWDSILIDTIEKKGEGWGIACGADYINDNWWKFRHPSACIISGNIVRHLGFFVLPALQHMWTDVYLRDISEGLGKLFFCPNVIIEHMHKNAAKADNDANYKWVYSPEQMTFGQKTYEDWKRNHYQKTLEGLREAIKKCALK